jgi:mono/diheme cytochrome c family protein
LAITLLSAVPTIARGQPLDMATAEQQFGKYCAKCHGSQGRGDGDLGALLRQMPRDFTNCAEMAKEPDDRLFEVIKNGGEPFQGQKSDMPAMGKALSDNEIRALLAYTRGFCLRGGSSVAQAPSTGLGKQSP